MEPGVASSLRIERKSRKILRGHGGRRRKKERRSFGSGMSLIEPCQKGEGKKKMFGVPTRCGRRKREEKKGGSAISMERAVVVDP